jgi:RNA polymerase sigma-70 factor (ECF subfamily)
MLQDHASAEDVSQEVFVTVFKSILSFNEKSQLSTWIYRITVNKCLDHLRAAGRTKRTGGLLRVFGNRETGELPEKPDFVHPGVLAEQREHAAYLFKAIGQLPDNQKTAFVLTHIEDLSQKDVAAIMDVSVKAVESLLQRAKGNLRKYLEEIRP